MTIITDIIINEINEKQIKEGRTLHLYEIRAIIDKHINNTEIEMSKDDAIIRDCGEENE